MDVLKNAINSLGTFIVDNLKEVIIFLFVPSNNLFTDIVDIINNKFGFIHQIIDLGSIIHDMQFNDTIPKFTVELYGQNYTFIDFSFYSQYREFIHNITVVTSYFFFSIWLLEITPSIIGGFTAFNSFSTKKGGRR